MIKSASASDETSVPTIDTITDRQTRELLTAARRWALARLAHEVACRHVDVADVEFMTRVEQKFSQDYIKRAQDADDGRRLIERRVELLKLQAEAADSVHVALDSLREVTDALTFKGYAPR